MKNYRKWILCGVGWLLLYVYFNPGLFSFFRWTAWRLWSMPSEEKHYWQPEFHALAGFGFSSRLVCIARFSVSDRRSKRK
jgi:hypothetical protein